MIRVIVAEDKPLILRSIKEKIQSCGQEIEIVGEATNGEAALALIKELMPDIVITDIRMPVMDGLKLISEVRKNDPDLHFVIISGYDEFEYARQAMKLNVFDYLLKPVKQDEINDILKKITEIIENRKLEHARAIIQNILHSNSATQASSVKNLNYKHYISILLNAGPYTNFIIDYANPFNSFWSSKNIEKILSEHLQPCNRFWIFDGKSFNELIVVLGIAAGSDINLEKLVEALKQYLHQYKIPVTIAVSKLMDNLGQIGIETQIVRALLRKNLVFGKSNVFFREELDIASPSKYAIVDSSLEKRIATYIQNNQKNLFFKEIDKLYKTWEDNGYTQNSIEKLLKQIIKLCQKVCLKQSNLGTDLELETDEVISSSKDYAALSQGMKFIFEQFFDSREKLEAKGDFNKDVINKVLNYIDTRFSDPITVNDIAKMVNLHPAYLSRLFKNSKGVSPMEYLTNLRIQKAKELILSHSSLSLKEIAEIVGYTDQFYFSRIFKAVTGQSPSEYKNANSGLSTT